MKRFLLSVCIPALTFFGFALKAHAAETHSAAAFMNAEGEGIFPKGKTNDATPSISTAPATSRHCPPKASPSPT